MPYGDPTSKITIEEGCWNEISVGSYHVLAIHENGTLWGWGEGKFGKLGSNGSTYHNPLPVQIGTDSDWIYVAAGGDHSLAIKEDGSLWSWGHNSSGQLGSGSNSNSNIPLQIGIDTDWVRVTAGSVHSGAIKNDGTLWIWGSNYYGQLGLGDGISSQNTPQQVGQDTNWMEISFTVESSLAIKTDGTRWGWGQNNARQLEVGFTQTIISSPIQGDADNDWKYVYGGKNRTSAGMKQDGTVWVWGESISSSPINWGENQSFIEVAAGNTTAFIAVRADGTRWGSGINSLGELGNGNTTRLYQAEQLDSYTNWSKISMGMVASLGVRDGNKLYSWGKNKWGEHGNDTPIDMIMVNPKLVDCPEVVYYTINTSSVPTNGGSTVGAGDYLYGSTATLMASANAGYIFINWTENDTVVSTNDTYSFTVSSNRSLVANFDFIMSTNVFTLSDMSVFPNPFTSVINFKSESSPLEKIIIYESSGRLIQDYNAKGTSALQVESSSLNSGMYLIKIYGSQGIKVLKLIKN